MCYAEGKGVEKSEAEAAVWFRRSAEANFAPAMYRYGLCFDKGSGGTPASTSKAMDLYRRAILLADPHAADDLPEYDKAFDVLRGNISAVVVRSTPSARELSYLNHREAVRTDDALSQLTSMIENLSVVSAEIAAASKLSGVARELAARPPHVDTCAAPDAANFVYSNFILSERNRTVSVVVTNAGGARAREAVVCTVRSGATNDTKVRSTGMLGVGQSEELVWVIDEWRKDPVSATGPGRRVFIGDNFRPLCIVIEGGRETASVDVEVSSLSQGSRKFGGTLELLG